MPTAMYHCLLTLLLQTLTETSALERMDLVSPAPRNTPPAFDPPSSQSAHPRVQRSGVIAEPTHLELLVVVGPDVHAIHRQDTERYILTNLNIASELLRDVTLGASMRVHLVRMIILTEAELGIQISANISSSLRSVCEWGQKVNPPGDTDPSHADLLLYVTRFDLELPNGSKLVRGVTQLGGVCSSQWSCIITEDTGFDLGITIAHEIGHSFGINHDGTGNTCSRSGYMMASDGGYNSVDLSWSPCSREQLQSFFRAGLAECVRDVPVTGDSLQDWKPGLYYGVDDQCRIAFGQTARACSFTSNDMATCRVLSCHTVPSDDTSCTRLLVPLLDGTECGPDLWCLKGQCVSPSELSIPMVVHGSWSHWSAPSPCSRSCGGGVTFRKRACNNPRPVFGGKLCEGRDVVGELCNQQPCDSTQLDYMSQQCSETDHQPLQLEPGRVSTHSWVPALGYTSGDEQCKMMCVARDQNFMVSRGSQFNDGTRCEPASPVPAGSVSACLGGTCQPFGCDGVLHSGKEEDECGVCGGNGSTCHLISHSYSGGEAREYVTFITLPVNATQIRITNSRPLFTHLAVLVNGKYVVAGNGSMAFNSTHPSSLEDRPLEYRLYLTPELLPQSEEVRLHGPVTEQIHIQVFRKYGPEYGELTSPNISSQYYSPGGAPAQGAVRGTWSAVRSPCSVTCGTGMQRISPVCMDVTTQEPLEEELCAAEPQTGVILESCLLPACPARALRRVLCVRTLGEVEVEVEEGLCSDPRPPEVTTCVVSVCPVGWDTHNPAQGSEEASVSIMSRSRALPVYVWSPVIGQCSRTCGNGTQQISFSCVDHQFRLEVVESHCEASVKPADRTESCNPTPCPAVWRYVEGVCSVSCGGGVARRVLYCSPQRGREAGVEMSREEVLQDSACQDIPRPQGVVPCKTEPCPARWRVGEQGVCSVSCGLGVAQRRVSCVRAEGGREGLVEEGRCEEGRRPPSMVPCRLQPCSFSWDVLPWSPCSVSCGSGIQSRGVACKGPMGPLPHSPLLCLHMPKPITIQACHQQDCHGNGTAMSPAQTFTSSPEMGSPRHTPPPEDSGIAGVLETHTAVPDPTMIRLAETPTALPMTSTAVMATSAQPTTSPQAVCGQLLLQESGTVDLRGVAMRKCIFAIGRPLNEVIHVRIEASSLYCRNREHITFYDRLILKRFCEGIMGREVTSRSNVLLIHQGRIAPGNGVLLSYRSVKKTNKSGCDVQLFGPSGVIVNPAGGSTSALGLQTCRVFIDAPPALRIQIQALRVNGTASPSTYILIRDVDTLKTTVYRDSQLFLWSSTKSRVEMEFHGEYRESVGSFQAEYSFLEP